MNNLTDEELDALKAAKNRAEWDAQCDAVKRARNGKYPADWYAKVVLSGVLQETVANFH